MGPGRKGQGPSPAQPQEADGTDDEEQSDEEDGSGVMTDPLITGLLKRLPDPKDGFDEDDRKLWLSTLEMNLAFIYSPPKKEWVFARPELPKTTDATETNPTTGA